MTGPDPGRWLGTEGRRTRSKQAPLLRGPDSNELRLDPPYKFFLLLARLDGETSVGKFNKREKSARVELRGSGK